MKPDKKSARLTRRKFLQRTALAGSAAIAFPYIRTANAAGKLSMGFWDHWVPGANDTLTKLVHEWADKEKVEVQVDYITSNGFKNLLTIQAEAQAKSGHDFLAFPTWEPLGHAELLEPMDDVMKELIAANGDVNPVVQYLGKAKSGHWVAAPASPGSQVKTPVARISLMKNLAGMDVQAAYPKSAPPNKELADKWTWDAFADAAAKCAKGDHAFGMPMGQTSDAVDWVGTVFHAYGAEMVNAKGEITIKSDATKQVMEWFKKVAPNLPPDCWAWDDAGNNKWLVSGKGALIMNPPSAWAVAKRDAPQVAADCWTIDAPVGPKGRFAPFLPFFWGVWSFSPNKSAAKSLITFLSS
ncbi:MAG TPA: twin-arginine translocation signal domain-containing protein, partial [Candidatus Sulfotelmatobacter sp.]|nr:twin-arginine translocation signal domain-containing protein [Candidatus Sulfotelmatobacter sp.]